MKKKIETSEYYTVYALEEENLNSLIAPELKTDFILMHNEGVPNLIFDLSGVNYVDSSGLSALLRANRLWSEQGSFVVAGPLSAGVRKIIEISRLDHILKIIPSRQEAIDYVFLEQIERNLSDAMEEE